MRFYLSDIQNRSKPTPENIKMISSTILNNPVDINLLTLAERLSVQGQTVMLAELSSNKLSKDTPIIQQQLIMLDFDNEDSNHIYTLKDLANDNFMQENAAFYYTTFNHSPYKQHKFRVVFKLDSPITSNKEIEKIYKELFNKYPQADSTVGQTTRLFFGGNKGYSVINWENKLSISNITTNLVSGDLVKADTSPDIFTLDTPVYILLRHRRYDLVKEKLGNNYSETFPDDVNAANYFKRIDMVELLELPDETPFLDILHMESNPSASVFFAKDVGIYLYKCFSQNHEFVGDILRLLSKYLGLGSNVDAIDLLLNITNGTIDYNSELGKQKRNSEIFRKDLLSGELVKTNPELYNYLRQYSNEIILTLDIMHDYSYINKETGEVKYLSYLSVSRLAKILSEVTKKKVTENKMWNILNVIVVTELVSKVPTNLLPTDLYDQLIVPQLNGPQIRTSTVYEPSIFNDESLLAMSGIAKILKENNVTISSLSFELVYRLFGEEKAHKDFPQAYKPLQDKGLIKMSEGNINITKKSALLEKAAIKIIMEELDSVGYIYEEELLKRLSRIKRAKITTVRAQYIKIRADLMLKYALNRGRLTKQMYSDLGMTGKYSSKVVIFR